MSQHKIMAALETHLATVAGALPTEHENMPFKPQAGAPYQRVSLLPAETVNATFGGDDWREQGIFQVVLCYPNASVAGFNGAGQARQQAERVRNAFPRGLSLAFDGLTVMIEKTPSVAPAYGDADRFCVPVRIRYFAHVHAGP